MENVENHLHQEKNSKAQELVKEYLVEKKWYTPFIQTDVPIRFDNGTRHKLSLVAYRLVIEINGKANEQVPVLL